MSDKFDAFAKSLTEYDSAERSMTELERELSRVAIAIRNRVPPFPSTAANWPSGDAIQDQYKAFAAAKSSCEMAWRNLPEAEKRLVNPPPFLNKNAPH